MSVDVSGTVRGTLQLNPVFTIVPGHAANFVKVTIQTLPTSPFLIFLRYTSTTGAPWNTLTSSVLSSPGIALLGQADANAVGANNVAGGRGVVIDVNFMIGLVAGIVTEPTGRSGSAWVLSDSSGFVDMEVFDSSKGTFFVGVTAPGGGLFTSRQIVAGDYA